jgi:hypothetical protein
MILNRYLTRLLEGYYNIPGRDYLLRKNKENYMKISGEIEGLEFLRSTFSDEEEIEDELGTKIKELRQYADYNHLMPTKFGNTIRAFEHYPRVVYNMDAIAIWPHMMYILPDSQKNELNAIRSGVDFAVNILWVSIILILEYIILSFYAKTVPILGLPVLLMIICPLAYRLAISSSIQWGFSVKAVFDLYRHDLLKKMGVRIPLSWDEERTIWGEINQSFVYWYSFGDDEVPRNR